MLLGLRDRPKISNVVCRTLENLCQSIYNDRSQRNNYLTIAFEDISRDLLTNAYRTDTEGTLVDLMLASFMALSAHLEKAGVDSFPVL